MMLFIAYETLTKTEVKVSMAHLGFPDYFRIELGVAKIIGTILIWLPVRLLKETAYIGFAIMFASATLAHTLWKATLSIKLWQEWFSCHFNCIVCKQYKN